MADLNETQLLLLDNLIYLEGVADKKDTTVKEVIDDLTSKNYAGLMKSRSKKEEDFGTDNEWPVCMTKDQWIDVLNAIKSDPKLMSLRIQNGTVQKVQYKDSAGKEHNVDGMVAACFVDQANNSTVVFRGTNGPYEWHDDGAGGYLSDTEQQKVALDYINSLPEYKYLTVTGHSKGGNKSQYVAVMSDKVNKCISYDGQGFSQEFLKEHKDRVDENAYKIKSISASNDFVNSLLFPIALNKEYISTPSEGKDFHHYHCPNIMLRFTKDDHGNTIAEMRKQGKQSPLSKLVNKFSIYVNTKVEDPKRREMINGLIAKFFEKKDAAESIQDQDKAIEMLKEVGIEFAKSELTLQDVAGLLCQDELHDLLFGMIREKYGPFAELGAAMILTKVCPILFAKDLGKVLIKDFKALAGIVIEDLKKIGDSIIEKIEQFGNWLTGIADDIGNALCNFVKGAKKAWGSVQNYVTGLYNDIVDTGKAVGNAIDNFKKKASAAVSNFFKSVANGVKNFFGALGKAALNTWDSAVKKATKTADWIVSATKSEIKKEYENFKEGANYLVTYAKKTLGSLGEKGKAVLKAFGKKVVRGAAAYMSAELSVDLFRLVDLQNKLRNLERNLDERVHRILNEASRVTSDVERCYSEYYVRQQVSAVNRTCDQIRETGRRACDALQRKANSLRYALDHYREIEGLLCGEIRT
ncbi:MAG TPA: Mbeg1-like protein [Clostridia bacterium]